MNSVINLLKLGLDGASSRQEALSNNIANVNTPDYKRKDVDFLSTLKSKVKEAEGEELKLNRTSGKHLARNQNRFDLNIHASGGTTYRNDGNNVDIDVEMTELAKNQIYYNTLTRQLNNKFSMIKDVISKGGK